MGTFLNDHTQPLLGLPSGSCSCNFAQIGPKFFVVLVKVCTHWKISMVHHRLTLNWGLGAYASCRIILVQVCLPLDLRGLLHWSNRFLALSMQSWWPRLHISSMISTRSLASSDDSPSYKISLSGKWHFSTFKEMVREKPRKISLELIPGILT